MWRVWSDPETLLSILDNLHCQGLVSSAQWDAVSRRIPCLLTSIFDTKICTIGWPLNIFLGIAWLNFPRGLYNLKLYKLSFLFLVNVEDGDTSTLSLSLFNLFAHPSFPPKMCTVLECCGGLDNFVIILSILAALGWSPSWWHITLVSLREEMFLTDVCRLNISGFNWVRVAYFINHPIFYESRKTDSTYLN